MNSRETRLEATEQLGDCFGTAVREGNGLEQCGEVMTDRRIEKNPYLNYKKKSLLNLTSKCFQNLTTAHRPGTSQQHFLIIAITY